MLKLLHDVMLVEDEKDAPPLSIPAWDNFRKRPDEQPITAVVLAQCISTTEKKICGSLFPSYTEMPSVVDANVKRSSVCHFPAIKKYLCRCSFSS